MAIFSDLQLDPDTHDIVVTDKDLVVISDTTDAIIQRLRIRLQFFKGEWFLNKLFGIPYHQTIFKKSITKDQADGVYRTHILNTPGVVEILTFTSALNVGSREYSLSFSCRASTGDTIVLEV